MNTFIRNIPNPLKILGIGIPILIFIIVGISECQKHKYKNAPPITDPPPEPLKEVTVEEELESFLEKWENAWEGQAINSLMALYHKDFNGRGMDYYKLRKYHEDVFRKSRVIEFELEKITYRMITDNRVEIKFRQKTFLIDHEGEHLYDTGNITMVVVKENDRWKIIYETWTKY